MVWKDKQGLGRNQRVLGLFTARGREPMPNQPEEPDGSGRTWMIRRLVLEAGVTEAEASDLIAMLGMDWSSLIREARVLKKNR